MNTLVLSNDYRPLGIVSWQKAIILAFKGRAEILEEYTDKVIRSISKEYKMPAVIKLIRHVGKVIKTLRYKKEHIFYRDNGLCQYCNKKISLKDSTLDHVNPRSKGGKTIWENIVLACKDCNLEKDAKTLEECNMKLIKAPIKPRLNFDFAFLISILFANRKIPNEWDNWINYENLAKYKSLNS